MSDRFQIVMINLIMKPSKRNQTVSLEYSCCKCVNYIVSTHYRFYSVYIVVSPKRYQTICKRYTIF